MSDYTDDGRRLAHRAVPGKPADDVVAERLAPERRGADRTRLYARIDAAAELTDSFAVLAADARDPEEKIAVAFPLAGAAATRAFLERFERDGIPTIWPCGAVIVTTVLPLDPADPETVKQLRDVPRGRWLLRAGDALVDPTRRPAVAGAERAARRRGSP